MPGAGAEACDGPGDDEAFLVGLRLVVGRVQRREARLTDADAQVAQAYAELLATLTAAAASIPREPVRAVFAAQIDDIDRAILRGLDQGPRSTLESRTGISRAVIDRRLHRLHRIAGTTTQFQLGRAACALRWLDAPD